MLDVRTPVLICYFSATNDPIRLNFNPDFLPYFLR